VPTIYRYKSFKKMKRHINENPEEPTESDDEVEGKAYDRLIEDLYSEVPEDTAPAA